MAEQASAAWYERAARVRGFSAGERRRLQHGRAAKVDHIKRINAVLGPDAIAPGVFDANFPESTFSSKARAVAAGASLENLLVGVFLNGAAFAADSATRLMLGRLLTFDAQQLAWMRGLEGAPAASGLAVPLSLEQAGAQLDRIVTTPNFPTP